MLSLFSSKYDTGRANELWPVLLLLLVVVVPTIGVLWFVGVAVENQQLATTQRLTNAYRTTMVSVRSKITADWDALEQRLESANSPNLAPSDRFQIVLRDAPVVSAVCFDEDGVVEYPVSDAPASTPIPNDQRWLAATSAENEKGTPGVALALYRKIAEDSTDTLEHVLALQAQVRCMLKIKDAAGAIDWYSTRWTNKHWEPSKAELAIP